MIDDARLHSLPTYVHCRAGKSRSVTVVLAFLIHSHRWPLKKAYAYVAERRRGISPNIGFMSELLSYEAATLHSGPSGLDHDEGDSANGSERAGAARIRDVSTSARPSVILRG